MAASCPYVRLTTKITESIYIGYYSILQLQGEDMANRAEFMLLNSGVCHKIPKYYNTLWVKRKNEKLRCSMSVT